MFYIKEINNGRLTKIRKYKTIEARNEALGVLRNTHISYIPVDALPKTKNQRYRQRQRIRNKNKLRVYKSIHGCKYCGSGENLTFHHRKDKVKNVCDCTGDEPMMWNEVAKCEVVCRTCHNKLHSHKLQQNTFHPYWIICYVNS